MKKDDVIFEQIENFLSGQMSDIEMNDFHKQLEIDANLQKELSKHQLVNDLVIENRLIQVNSVLLETHRGNNDSKSSLKTISLVLVAGLLCCGGVWSYLSEQTNVSNETLQMAVKLEKPLLPKANSNDSQIVTNKKQLVVSSTEIINIKKPFPTQILDKKRDELFIENKSIDEKPTISGIKKIEQNNSDAIISKIENKVESNVVNKSCEGILLVSNFTISNTCEGEELGAISLKACTGGTAPYKLNVFDKYGNKLMSNYNLPGGEYTTVVQDAKGCQRKEELLVNTKSCSKDYIFNPFSGDELEIPLGGKSGVISIQDRQGNLYARFTLTDETLFKWNGISKNGDIKEGFYNFAIEYADKTTSIGTISIVR